MRHKCALRKKCAHISDGPEDSSVDELIEDIISAYPKVDRNVSRRIVESEIKMYGGGSEGEGQVIAFNRTLCLDSKKKPRLLPNSYFYRDPFSIFGKDVVISRMAHSSRASEAENAYNNLKIIGVDEERIHTICGDGTFEGGDAMIIDGKAYVGNDTRTNIEGICQVAEAINMQVMVIEQSDNMEYHPKYTCRIDPKTGNSVAMDVMHMDTFMMPVTPEKFVICSDIAEKCEVYPFNNRSLGENLKDYILRNFSTIECFREEQVENGTNMLTLRPGYVLSSSPENSEVVKAMKREGIEVMSLNIPELSKGGGGFHCMTGYLFKRM